MGYYSGLLQGMLAREEIAGKQQQRQMNTLKMQQTIQGMQRQQREQQILSEAFKGGAADRAGMESAQGDHALAGRMASAGSQIMSIDPSTGARLLSESRRLKADASAQDLRNVNAAIKKNELVEQTAMTVYDPATLNDAVQTLTRSGVVIPGFARQWGPQAQRWWGMQANVAKQRQAMLKTDAVVLNAKSREQAVAEKVAHDKETDNLKRSDQALKRYGAYQKTEAELRKEFVKAKDGGDSKRAWELYGQMNKAKAAELKAQGKKLSMAEDPEAMKVKSAMEAGELTYEEAVSRLKELGYE